MIRSLTRDDLPRLADLHLRCFPDPDVSPEDQYRQCHAVYAKLFPALYLDHPWSVDRSSSLISEDKAGELTGMIAVMNRPFESNGRKLNAAVSAELFVNPESRGSLSGVQLLKRLLNGPQDLTIADSANDTTQRLWHQLGGATLPMYGMNWAYLAEPCRFAVAFASERTRLAKLATPASRIGDRVLKRLWNPHPRNFDPNVSSRPLCPAEFASLAPMMSTDREVRPVYSPAATPWLWSRLNFIADDAGVSQQLVVLRNNDPIGWIIWQVMPGGIARVSQLAALAGEEQAVVQEMVRLMRRQGICGAIGRMQPEFLPALQQVRCLFARHGRHVLIHSRDTAILNAFRKGTAFLSMLDGEAAVQLWNNPVEAIRQMESLRSETDSIPLEQPHELPAG